MTVGIETAPIGADGSRFVEGVRGSPGERMCVKPTEHGVGSARAREPEIPPTNKKRPPSRRPPLRSVVFDNDFDNELG